jgi:2-polyprenyl-3-methyl-5-hydroxy-6-metoxy-1,4-benzoquinol methylase
MKGAAMPPTNAERAAHNALQRRYYENRRAEQNHRIAVEATPYIANHLDQLIALSGLSKSETILDIGCGMGKYTIPLAERGFDVAGLELSPRLIEQLQQKAEGRAEIETHVGDILDPDAALLNRFDRVVGFFVLHHLIDIPAACKSAARMLRPGGRIAILEPNPLCPLYYLQVTFTPSMSWAAEKGILSLKPGQTRRALAAAGFEDVALHRFGILPPFLRNRPFGARAEAAFNRISPLRPIAAFQLITGRLAAA